MIDFFLLREIKLVQKFKINPKKKTAVFDKIIISTVTKFLY